MQIELSIQVRFSEGTVWYTETTVRGGARWTRGGQGAAVTRRTCPGGWGPGPAVTVLKEQRQHNRSSSAHVLDKDRPSTTVAYALSLTNIINFKI